MHQADFYNILATHFHQLGEPIQNILSAMGLHQADFTIFWLPISIS
jgi:hypothetical protein